VLDQNLRVITASRSFYNTFRLTRDDDVQFDNLVAV
jgi:hypothetical protein